MTDDNERNALEPPEPDLEHIVEEMAPIEEPRYRYQIGASGYWVECRAPTVRVGYPDGHHEIQKGMRLTS